MEDNVMQKQADMEELRKMLDTVANQDKDAISKGKEELVDIRKYNGVTFETEQNGQKVTLTKNIFEVLIKRDGEIWHEFYDDQGNSLARIPDEKYQNFKSAIETGNVNVDKESLVYNILSEKSEKPEKSLLELEDEQKEQVAEAVGMDKETIQTLGIMPVDGNQKTLTLDEQKKNLQEQIQKFAALGMEIDTRELATSDDTIKEILGLDSDKLLIVQINGDWRALEVFDDGTISMAKNLEIIDNKQAFNTVGDDGRRESRIPEIEFRRKDNTDISLAVDSNNRENQPQLFIVVGNSRSGAEIETKYTVSPYADSINNELVQKAQENPDDEKVVEDDEQDDDDDRDPHEPDEPGDRQYY